MNSSRFLSAEATEYEFKQSLEVAKAKSWLKTVSAFSNGLGGSIYFGVDKDGVARGLEDVQKVSEKISQLVHSKIEPMVQMNMTPVEVEDGCVILRVEIRPGLLTPYYYSSDGNKIAFVRLGEESVQCPPYILNELILKGKNQTFDAMESPFDKRDFSFSVFEATYRERTGRKIDESDYRSFKLVGEQQKLTYAGLMVSDQCPLLQSRVFCTRWNGLTMGSIFDDAIDDKEYEGNVFSLLENTKQFIRNNSKVRWKKSPDGRIDMPDYEMDAIHEAVVNALVHRSYLLPGTEIHIDMYDDRLEIGSPGGMFSGKKIQLLDLWDIPSERRNPVLADLFQRMRLMERRGSGIKKILEIYEGKKTPWLESTESHFKTVFFNANYKKTAIKNGGKKTAIKNGDKKTAIKAEQKAAKILDFMEVGEPYTTGDIAEVLELKASHTRKILGDLVMEDKIEARGSNKGRVYVKKGI